MGIQNKINGLIFRQNNAGLISNAKYISGYLGAQAAGNSDLYTCPSGKRAFIGGVYGMSSNGNSATCQVQIKSSGTYYPVGNSATANATISGLWSTAAIILDAGEIISVASTGTGSANLWATIVQFDASSPTTIKSVKSYTVDHTTTVTLYTCPAGKTAYLLGPGCTWDASSAIAAYNNTGGNLTNGTAYIVNSGGSPGTSNQANKSMNTGYSPLSIPCALSAGDSIRLATNAAASDAVTAWLNIIEI